MRRKKRLKRKLFDPRRILIFVLYIIMKLTFVGVSENRNMYGTLMSVHTSTKLRTQSIDPIQLKQKTQLLMYTLFILSIILIVS